MIDAERLLAALADARFAALLVRRGPAWAFAGDGTPVLANRAGRAILDAAAPDAVAPPPFQRDVERWRRALPADGKPCLERLRSPGAGLVPLTIACRRLADTPFGELILVTSAAPGDDRPVPLAETARLIAEFASPPLLVADAFGAVLAGRDALALAGAAETLSALVPDAANWFAEAAQHPAGRRIGAANVTLHAFALGSARLLLGRVAPADGAALSAAAPSREAPAEPAAPPPQKPADAARRTPLRFVWQTDAAGRLTYVSDEFAAAVGPRTAAVVGEGLVDLARRFGASTDTILDALARRGTWSGVEVPWPTDSGERALVDLAGLPVFDRDRAFLGYRGFGVCRFGRADDAAASPPSRPTTTVATVVETARAMAPAPAESVAAPPSAEEPVNSLTEHEQQLFLDIGDALGTPPPPPPPLSPPPSMPPPAPEAALARRAVANGETALLDRLPLAVLVHRADRVLFANPALLAWSGHASVEDIERAGGLAALFAGNGLDDAGDEAKELSIRDTRGGTVPVEARLFTAPWQGESAIVLVLRRADDPTEARLRMLEVALRDAEASTRELRAILDTATDGVALLDRSGRILSVNSAGEALFGYDGRELVGRSFGFLFAPESQRAAFDYLEGLVEGGVASLINDGREVLGRVREGGLIPLFMTLGHIGDGEKLCAVFRDITQWKRAEDELIAAKRAAERASSHKSDFLAKISHEIRTPLNAIIGFSEVMMEEQFGPVGNARYKEYLKDIHTSGAHVVSLVNDLLDLSKIEAGKLDLEFVGVDLNEILAQCMSLMQPQANRERIIIRTSLAPALPRVVADIRSIKQIVLNLLTNAIKFTLPGGQVILSTALSDVGEVMVRVRDTGVGMSEADVQAALEPFRQVAANGRGGRADGTGLGLPLTKALVEANRAGFAIRSAVNAGTMVEITFPPTRVLAAE